MPASRNAVAALFVAMEGRFAKFDAAMQQAAGKFDRFSKKMDKIGNNLSKNLTLPLLAIGKAALTATKQMDEAMDKIRISTGKTGAELQGLQSSFKKVFTGDAAANALDTATAVSELSKRLKLTGPELEKAATQMLVMTRLTGTDLNSNLKASAQLFNQWGVAAGEQAGVMDMLFTAYEKTGVGVDTLMQSLTQFGPALQTAGFSLTQSTALLGQLEANGIDSGAAMAGLTKALRAMADKGIKDIPTALSQMVGDIKNAKTETQALSMANLLFGKSSVAVTKAIRSGQFDVAELVKTLQNSGGAIESARQDTDGLAETMTRLGNKFIIAAEPLEGALTEGLKALEPLIQKVADGVNWLSEKFAELSPEWKAVILGVVGFVAAAGPLALIVSGITAGLSGLLTVVGLLLSPWTVLIAAIATAVALMQTPEFQRGWEILKQKLEELYESFMRGAQIVAQTVDQWKQDFDRGVQVVIDFATKLKAKLVEIKDAIVDAFHFEWVDDFNRGLDRIYDGFSNLKTRLLDHSPLPEIEEGVKKTFVEGGKAAVDATQKTTDKLFSQWDLFAKKNKGQMGEIEKNQKAVASALDSAFEAIERAVFDKKTDNLDAFSEKLFEAIQKKDIPALKKLAKQFITTADKANDFSTALGKASEKNEQLKKDQEELQKVLAKLDRNFDDLNSNLTETATKFKKLFQKGDVAGAKKYAEELLKGGKSLEEITTAMRDAREEIHNLREEALDAASGMVDAFGSLAETLGAPSEAIGNLTTGFHELIKVIDLAEKGLNTNTFGDVFSQLGDLFSGNIDAGGLKNLATTLGQMAQAASAILEPFLQMGKDGGANDLAQGVQGGFAVLGTAIGAYFGGPGGAAAGAQIGSSLGALIPGLTDTDSPDHEGRKAVEQWIEDILKGQKQKFTNAGGMAELFNNNILRGGEGDFTDGDWAQQFAAMGDDAMRVFGGLGEALKQLLGITEDVGGQIGFILAQTFAGNIDNARLLVQLLGVDFDQLSEALLQSAVKGQISWHEYAVELQGLQQAFEPGLVAVGNMTGAVDNLIASGGRGLLAIKSLRDLSIEATEAGAKDLNDLRAKLLASGKYTVQQIDQIFAALEAGGITTLDQLKDANDQTLGLIVANLESMGFAFDNVDQEIGDMNEGLDDTQNKVDGILSTIEKIPSEVHTKVVVDYEEHGSPSGDSGGSDSGGGSSNQVARTAGKSLTTNRLARSVADTVKKTITTTTKSSSSKSKSKSKKPSKEEEQAAQAAAEAVVQELASVFPDLDFGKGDKFSMSHYTAFFQSIAAQFGAMTGAAQSFGTSLGNSLKSVMNLSDDAAAKLNQLLAVELAGNIDNARHFVSLMKFDFEDLANGLVDLANKGDITWGQFATQVQQVTDMFKPGISAAGAYAQALDNFWGSGGTGFDAIQSLRDMGIEALEAQIKTVDQLKAALIAAGRPADQVEKLFAAIGAQGIKTTEQLAQISDVIAGTITGNAANSGFGFATLTPPAPPAPPPDPEEQRLRDRLAAAKNSTERKRRQQELDKYLTKRKAEKGYGGGAVVLNGLARADLGSHIARMAEFQPEIIAPLSKLAGYMPDRVKRGLGSGGDMHVVYNINAPNSSPGSVEALEQMMRRVHDSAVKTSLMKTADMARRGGGFSNALRGG